MTQNNETAPQPKNTDIKFSIAMLLEIGFEALKAVERSNPKSFPRDLNGEIYTAFEQALANPMQGWLSRKNHIPPTDRDILALCENGVIYVTCWHTVRKVWYNPTCAKGSELFSPMVLWQPLPQPPQGDL